MAVSNSLPIRSLFASITPQRPLIRVMQNGVLLEIEPDATKTAFIPVEAIANGVVTIQVEITSRRVCRSTAGSFARAGRRSGRPSAPSSSW